MFDNTFEILQIVFADIILSGDNVLVIGMAAASLSPELRKKAIFMGIGMAAALRIFFAAIIMKAMTKYAWRSWAGHIFLVYLSLDMIHDVWPEIATMIGVG